MTVALKKVIGVANASLKKIEGKIPSYLEFINTSLYSSANLKAYYRMEGNSTDTKNAHNGTDTDMTYGTTYGKFGQGALFNGSTSKIILTQHADFNPAKFTISAWVKRDVTGSSRFIFNSSNLPGAGFSGIGFAFLSNNKLYCPIGSEAGGTGEFYSTNAYTDTTSFHHVGVTYDGTNVIFYYDGLPAGSTGHTTDPVYYTADNRVNIGMLSQLGSEYYFWDGNIDDVLLFNAGLSAANMLTIYNNQIKKFIGVSNV